MRVIGVDAGYTNFCVCGIDSEDPDHPYYWENRILFEGGFSEEKLVAAIYAWINLPHIKELLDQADVIVLERQMAMKFQAINHCIRFLYFNKTKEVSPMSVGAFYGLPKERRPKKKAAVDLVSEHVVLPVKRGKKDDYADSFLLAMYELAGDKTLASKYQPKPIKPVKKRLRTSRLHTLVMDVNDL